MAILNYRPTIGVKIDDAILAVVHPELSRRYNEDASLNVGDVRCAADATADQQTLLDILDSESSKWLAFGCGY